jgi:metallophosphoesterase superfamily enzyme
VLREAAARRAPLAEGIDAVAPGLLWMRETRTIVAADAHLAYEDVIGGALPTWSTGEAISVLQKAAEEFGAREFLFLGDIIHGARMSDGAALAVQSGLERLRAIAQVTLVAGNHEGRTRGADVLGETVEFAERSGWLLVHGDNSCHPELSVCHPELVEGPRAAPGIGRKTRGVIIGHLHPSVRSNGTSAPAFLSGSGVIVVPALTPYSEGLDVCGDDCFEALKAFGVTTRGELQVVAATEEAVYPLGSVSGLQKELRRPWEPPQHRYRRRFLRPDR